MMPLVTYVEPLGLLCFCFVGLPTFQVVLNPCHDLILTKYKNGYDGVKTHGAVLGVSSIYGLATFGKA